jgi:uncharacterized protein involved in response to NO
MNKFVLSPLWVAAYAIFLKIYVPILISPRK